MVTAILILDAIYLVLFVWFIVEAFRLNTLAVVILNGILNILAAACLLWHARAEHCKCRHGCAAQRGLCAGKKQ